MSSLKNDTNYITSGSNQINPWGFVEKTFNMLTFSFYESEGDDDVPDIIKESKPLREKFKFVMIKITQKWLNALREQQKNWDIEKLTKPLIG